MSEKEISIKVFKDEQDVGLLEKDWKDLWLSCNQATVFQSYEWNLSAWQWVKERGDLHLVCIYRKDTLSALVPLVIKKESYLRIRSLKENSFILNQLQDELNSMGLDVLLRKTGSVPYIKNNHIANKIKKRFPDVRVRWLTSSSCNAEDLIRAIDQYIAISSASWKKSTGLTLNHRGPGSFIRTLSRYAMQNSWLSLWFLELDHRAVAGEYQIIHDGVVYALRADYLESHADLSPGTYLNWKILENLFESDLHRYDMGPGHNAYKSRWAEYYEDRYEILIYGSTMKGLLLSQIDKRIVPLAKQYFQKGKSAGPI